MAGQKEASKLDTSEAKAGSADARQRSTIAFPYADLESVVNMATAMFNNVGGGGCDDDQLAAWTEQSSKSSSFRVQVYAARMFGVLEGEGGRHRLSELGLSIVDGQRERAARVQAFLTVPLYRSIFEQFRGRQLPPAAALEREFVTLGVAPKQKERARQVFERAAEQAGFFAHGSDRLVEPGIQGGQRRDAPPPEDPERDRKPKGNGGDGGGDTSGMHPFIQGLLKTLPPPETEWDGAGRAKWLQTAANIFDLIYKGDGAISVSTAVASRSPKPS